VHLLARRYVEIGPWSRLMSSLMPYLLVGLGGFLGANARFVLARVIGTAVATRFPLGTFVVNVTGSLLLGLLGTLVAAKLTPGSESMRLALGVGFLGAYTTFSTFEFETHALVEDGAWIIATANMALSLVVGFIALRVGVVLARTWLL
jgi:fluoride exporter